MSADESQKVILVADSSPEDLWNLTNDPRTKTVPMVAAANEREAASLISKPGQRYSAIFINPEIQAPYAMKLIQLAMKFHPSVPLFYLTNRGSIALTNADLESFGIRKVLRKPVSYGDLVRVGRLFTESFDSEAAIAIALSCPSPLGAEIEGRDDEFVSIRAAQFLSGSVSFFDVHLRTREGRFTKIVRAGQRPDAEKLAEHAKNGVTMYYLRANAHEHYVRYCSHLGAILAKKTGVPLQLKAGFLFNHGEEVLQFVRRNGLDETAADYARRFLENMRTFVQTMPFASRTELLQFLVDMSGFSHEIPSVFIAFLLCQALGIEAERLLENVGLAALLQDIGLSGMPAGFNELDAKKLEGRALENYLRHPLESGRLVRRLDGIDRAVIQAIEQHHERKDQTGFPYGLGVGAINQFAELVGLADEFSSLAKKAATVSDLDRAKEWELGLSSAFSSRTAEAFRSVFSSQGRFKANLYKPIQGGRDVA